MKYILILLVLLVSCQTLIIVQTDITYSYKLAGVDIVTTRTFINYKITDDYIVGKGANGKWVKLHLEGLKIISEETASVIY